MDNLSKIDLADAQYTAMEGAILKVRKLFVEGINGTNSVEEKNALQRCSY
ncbi:MAG: hypothetical protein HRT47_00680 [Candidatus Caenarcaniphilales bacterium]|nr:hypothetical protein [Candidatus Caenarcaniphilales bacterium]